MNGKSEDQRVQLGGITGHVVTRAPAKEDVAKMQESQPSAWKSRLSLAAARPLDEDKIHEDTELEMYREQQEMISSMCKMQAERETEKEVEEEREREQILLMRLEQLNFMRIKEQRFRMSITPLPKSLTTSNSMAVSVKSKLPKGANNSQ